MVQRYPSSGRPVDLERLPAPPSVAKAVKLMYAGAAVSTVNLIVSLADISGTKAAITRARPGWTVAQVNQFDRFIIGAAIVSGLITIALWLWMAYANNQGKSWARIVSTILFCLNTVDVVGVFNEPKTALGLVFPVLTWLVGLGALFLLWRPDSSAFFKPQGLR
jgi:hypothetical protein